MRSDGLQDAIGEANDAAVKAAEDAPREEERSKIWKGVKIAMIILVTAVIMLWFLIKAADMSGLLVQKLPAESKPLPAGPLSYVFSE